MLQYSEEPEIRASGYEYNFWHAKLENPTLTTLISAVKKTFIQIPSLIEQINYLTSASNY